MPMHHRMGKMWINSCFTQFTIYMVVNYKTMFFSEHGNQGISQPTLLLPSLQPTLVVIFAMTGHPRCNNNLMATAVFLPNGLWNIGMEKVHPMEMVAQCHPLPDGDNIPMTSWGSRFIGGKAFCTESRREYRKGWDDRIGLISCHPVGRRGKILGFLHAHCHQ